MYLFSIIVIAFFIIFIIWCIATRKESYQDKLKRLEDNEIKLAKARERVKEIEFQNKKEDISFHIPTFIKNTITIIILIIFVIGIFLFFNRLI